MKPIRWVVAALMLATAGVARAQMDEDMIALRKYDLQDRKAVAAIDARIKAATPLQIPTIEESLAGVLADTSATFYGRQEAARFIWQIGAHKSVPVLAKLLPDPKLGNVARYALERSMDPAAGAALRAALNSTSGATRVGVINSIGDRGDPLAVAALKKLAAGGDMLASEAAITALGKIGTPVAVEALFAMRSKPSALAALVRAANKAEAAGKTAEAKRLYLRLSDLSNPPVTVAAGLRGLESVRALEASHNALVTAKVSKDENLQRVAGHILGMDASPSATRAAVAAYGGLPAAAQIALLTAWADRKEPVAAPVAFSAMKSADADVRRAAIQTAAIVGGPTAVRLLAMSAVGSDAGVARDALARMKGPGVDAAIIHEAGAGSPEVQAALMAVLGQRPGAATRTALLGAARGSDTRVAAAALKALGGIGSLEQVPDLVRLLVATPQDEVRDAAQSAIVAIAQRTRDRDQAAGALNAAFAGATPAGKAALLGAMADVGGDAALQTLTAASESSDEAVKTAAVNALANTWSDSRPLTALLRVARTDTNRTLRVNALRGYLRLTAADNRAAPEERLARVSNAMSSAERPEEKRMALSALKAIRTPEAVTLAAKSLDDEALRAEAADAIIYLAADQGRGPRRLRAVRGPETVAALEKVIRVVSDDNVKAQARRLL